MLESDNTPESLGRVIEQAKEWEVRVGQQRPVKKRDEGAGLVAAENLQLVAGFDPKAVQEDLRKRLADWQGLLQRQPAQARQILRKMIVGRLTLTRTMVTVPLRAKHRWAKC